MAGYSSVTQLLLRCMNYCVLRLNSQKKVALKWSSSALKASNLNLEPLKSILPIKHDRIAMKAKILHLLPSFPVPTVNKCNYNCFYWMWGHILIRLIHENAWSRKGTVWFSSHFQVHLNSISPPKANMFYHSYLKNSLFIYRARHAKLSKLGIIWTHDRDVRAMVLFSIVRHKLLCNAKFLWKQECKAVCDLKSRIDPYHSRHGRGSKLLLVFPR